MVPADSAGRGALITTAIMQMRAKRDLEIDGLLREFQSHYSGIAMDQNSSEEKKAQAQKMLRYIECWAKEAEAVNALSGAGSGFQQQGSGIDVFSAFFPAYKLECRSYTSFPGAEWSLSGGTHKTHRAKSR